MKIIITKSFTISYSSKKKKKNPSCLIKNQKEGNNGCEKKEEKTHYNIMYK